MRRYIFHVVLWGYLAGVVFMPVATAEPSTPAGAVYNLFTNNRSVHINGDVAYFFEPSPMTPIQAAGMDASKWIEHKGKLINLGATHHPVWLRFDLRNLAASEVDWLLEINWGYLDRIEVFLFHHDLKKWEGPLLSGMMVPLSERVVPHSQYLFPLTLSQERTTVYIRAASNSKLIVPLRVWQKEAFEKSIINRAMLLGIFFGILTVMACYNFLLYIPTRNTSFFYFSIFVFTLILYTLMPTGIGTFYLWDKATWLKGHSYGLFSSLSFLMAAIFIRRYLGLESYGGWILKLNSILLGYWSFSTVVYLFWSPPFFVQLEDLMALLSTIAGMVTAVYCLVKKDSSERLFTIAWGVTSCGTVLLILALQDIVESNWITTYGQMGSFALFVILHSFALAERINCERSARAEAQKKTLDLSHKVAAERAANLKAQEEMLDVQRQTNEELELRVKDRAAQLEQAMQRLAAANTELAQLNITDALTKLYNRRYFDHVLVEEIRRGHRNGQPLSVIMADIDHFKSINDTHGHLIGDECLRLVARTIQEKISAQSNLVARYGGEEFALILPSISAEAALLLAEQLRIAVEKLTFSNRGTAVELRISLGVAGWVPRSDDTPEKLIRTADNALYHAKQRGRNRAAIAEID